MANSTRLTHKINEEGTRGTRSSARLASAPVSAVGDSPGLRRSTREPSSNKMVTPEHPTTRNSEGLEKQTPPASSVTRSSVKKRQIQSPIRRSERCKKQQPSLSSSGSKNSGKNSGKSVSLTEKMEEGKKENSTKRLSQRAKEASRVDSADTKSNQTKKVGTDAHAYKALFQKQVKKAKPSVHYEDFSSRRKSPAHDCIFSESHNSREFDASESYQGNSSRISKKLSFSEQIDNPGNASNLDSSVNNNFRLSSPSRRVPNASDDLRRLEENFLVQVLPERVDSMTNGRPSDGDGYMDMCPEVAVDASAVADCKNNTPGPSPSSSTNLCVEEGGLNLKRKSGELEAGLNSRVGKSFTENEQLPDQPLEIQANGGDTDCFICKLGGFLLCCDGKDCKRFFHLSCLSPPLKDVPLGVWYCPECVRKKMVLGVHSVSQGVEAIVNVREVEAVDTNGSQLQKQFFVKYKGLAHIHNRWVPEGELLLESPSAISRSDKRNQTLKWNPEWVMPRRLLERRLENFKQHDEGGSADKASCCYQWLVKWCGLGYEHATWELEDEPFFNSSEAENLIKEFEARHDRAKRRLSPEMHKLRQRKKASRSKLSKLPDGISAGSDSNCLDVVNRLLEFWKGSHNAIIIDDQEYMLKVISFIASLQSNACHPFLIISSSNFLYSWDVEFFRLARSINLVVYNGDKDLRKRIRKLEFLEEGAATMLQVLLSAPMAIAEDMDVLNHIEWEAIIVDGCQHSCITKHFKEFKLLNTEMRLLLYKGPLKERFSEYSDLLSLLSGWRAGNGFGTSSSDTILKMKQRLSCFIVSGCRVESCRFQEYWVPVQLSDIQLEQYCATLHSNSLSLCSSSKTDRIGALRDILFASRKCCDHPYLVDPSVQKLLIKDLHVVQYLDVGIKACGKLQILDKLLFELQNHGLRALIMFQSIGSSGRDYISIGDILDDFLRQRFGADSYERIDRDLPRHKKVAAMNNYNNKDLRRFFFLLEARARLPGIKLVSVDVVIIFGSDWNPVNDIRNLQKLQLESQFEQIQLFRLYTSCTVEEKVLIDAKNGDSIAIRNAHPNSCHSLLMWGAQHLFDNLKEFHHSYRPSSCTTSSDESHTKNVLQELLSILPQSDENKGRSQSSSLFLISRAEQRSQTYYSKGIRLPGESKVQSQAEELPHLFWIKLLAGKAPDWKYSFVSQQRNRKRVQMNGSKYADHVDSNDIGKKRRKVAESNVDLCSKKQGKDESTLAAANHKVASCPVQLSSQEKDAPVASHGKVDGSDGRRTLRDGQSHLHLILKNQISRLCEALSLEGEVRDMVYTFLNYVINNRVVNQEPAAILQAFQLALCWTAASLVKLKINHKESLGLARERLNYSCSNDEAEGVYTILRELKKPFLRHIEKSEAVTTSKAPEKVKETPVENLNSNFSQQPVFFPRNMKVEIEDCPFNQESFDKDVLPSPILVEKGVPFSIQEIQGMYSEPIAELLSEQEREIYRSFVVEKGALEDEQRLETFFIKQLHRDGPIRAEKLKALEKETAAKIKECENQLNMRLKEIKEAELAAKNKVQRKEASSVGVTCQDDIDSVYSMPEARNQVENLQSNDCEESQRALSAETAAVEEEATVPVASVETGNENENLGTHKVLGYCAGAGSDKDLGDPVCVNPFSEENIPDRATPAVPGCEASQGQIAEETAVTQNEAVQLGTCKNINDISGHAISVISKSKDVPHKEASTVSNGDVASDVVADVSTSGIQAPENLVSVHQSSEDGAQMVDDATRITPDEEPALCLPENSEIEQNREVHPHSPREQVVDELILEDPGVVPDGVDTVPEDDHNEVESASEHHKDEISPMLVDNVMSGDSQDISGQLMATPSHGVVMPLNQTSINQESTSSMPDRLQEENTSQQSSDMPLDFRTAQPSDRANPEASGTEAAVQVPGLPSTLQTADGMSHQHSSGLDTQNAQNQFWPRPSMPTTSQMAMAYLGPLGIGSHTIQPSLRGATQMALPKCSDPLQNELDRLRLESDLATKIYEDTKSKLQADCEREIAQIRRKYETKILETEAEYLLKRNKLQLNENMVLMSKILAEAFQSKCMDVQASASRAAHQDAVASYTWLLPSLSQQNPQASPSFIPGPSSSALLQNSTHTAASDPINSRGLRPPAASTPPVIGQFCSAGNIQIQRNVQATAPQVLSSTWSSPALPRGAPPPQPCYPPITVTNSPPRPTQNSGSHRPDRTSNPLATHVSRGSALELLRDIAMRPLTANQQPSSLQLPSMNLTVSGNSLEVRTPGTGNDGTAAVVCLSDDD